MEIGKKIKKYREKVGVTQEALAEKAGVRVATISRIENGHNEPYTITLKALADVLDVSVDELRGE